MEENLLQKIVKAFYTLDSTILLDAYAEENVVFGRAKNGDRVSFKQYVEDLQFRGLHNYALNFDEVEGAVINKGIISYDNIEDLYCKLYGARVCYLFEGVPIVKKYEDEDDHIDHFKYGLYEYLKELYNLFREIIVIEVNPDLFTATPDILDEQEQSIYYETLARFFKAVMTKKLKTGSRVDRYFKDIPFISPLVRRIIKKQDGHFILSNADKNSLDFKFALMSSFRFFNEASAKLLELKMLRWEELNSKSN